MLYVVSYDIQCDAKRLKASSILKDYGERVQKSVFECLITPDLAAELVSRVKGLVDPQCDSIRIYGICSSCRSKTVAIGKTVSPENKDVYIV